MKTKIPHVDSYSFGRISIDGRVYTKDLIITPDKVLADWWRKQGHNLHPEDLKEIERLTPQTLIIGCGANNVLKVPRSTRDWIASKGVELIDLPTKEACERYNRLASESLVVAGLHLTC